MTDPTLEEAAELLEKLGTLYVIACGLIPANDGAATLRVALAWSKKAELCAKSIRAALARHQAQPVVANMCRRCGLFQAADPKAFNVRPWQCGETHDNRALVERG